MKNIFYIVTFLLFVLPTNNTFACGNTTPKADTEMSCSKSLNDHDSEKKSCCNSNDEDSENNDCVGNCNNNSCHCPTNIHIPVFTIFVNIDLKPLISTEVKGWAYIQSIPQSVYLSIWQPPKIS